MAWTLRARTASFFGYSLFGERLALIFCEDMVVTKSAFELLDLLDALDEESGESLAAPIHLKSIREAITR